jgi:hypothetical protein
MSYWHYPDGAPAPWGKGRFDWSHIGPWIPMIVLMLLASWCR